MTPESQSKPLAVLLASLSTHECGVAGYTVQLWRYMTGNVETSSPSLSRDTGWKFLVSKNYANSLTDFPEAEIYETPRDAKQLQTLLEQLDCQSVLVQFVSYAFDGKGVPRYLADALKAWKSKSAGRKLFIMFHEVWEHGFKPWKSSFWLRGKQRSVIRTLLETCDAAVASNGMYASMLRRLNPSTELRVIPVGSNFAATSGAPKNSRKVLIFGLNRMKALKMHARLIKLLANGGHIDSVVLAGRYKPSTTPEEIAFLESLSPALRIETAFDFDFANVPESVRTCGVSLMDAPSGILAKSGRFHLSCALGQVSITISRFGTESPLALGENFLAYKKGQEKTIVDAFSVPGKLREVSEEAEKLTAYFSWETIAEHWKATLQTR